MARALLANRGIRIRFNGEAGAGARGERLFPRIGDDGQRRPCAIRTIAPWALSFAGSSRERSASEVYLIGAGPGAVDLLSLRAGRLLATADVVPELRRMRAAARQAA